MKSRRARSNESLFDVQSALVEVQTKSEKQIEQETAYRWCARALACYSLYGKTGQAKLLLEAERFADEAKEHAAMASDRGVTLHLVESTIDRVRPKF